MEQLWAPWRLDYIRTPRDEDCIFCLDQDPATDRQRYVLARGETSFVIMNRYPYANGHLLIAPFRHLADHAELNEPEVLEIHQWMTRSESVLRQSCGAQGFNVGWNIGQVAGAGIAAHIHLHVVPRWAGDTNFMPVLAETRVIPEHLDKTYSLLVEGFLGGA